MTDEMKVYTSELWQWAQCLGKVENLLNIMKSPKDCHKREEQTWRNRVS